MDGSDDESVQVISSSPNKKKTNINTSPYGSGVHLYNGSDPAANSEFGDVDTFAGHPAASSDPHDLSDLKNPGKPTSNMATLMNLIKGNVGIGILAMPSALVNAGLLLGTVGILVIGFICTYCMKQLLDVSLHLTKLHPHLGVLNYPDSCYQAIALGPKKLRCFAKFMRYLVNVFIVTAQTMGCTAYLLFISGTLSQLVEMMTGFKMDIKLWQLIVLGALLPMVQVRSLRVLAWFTTVANVCVAVSLTIIFQYIVRNRTVAFENLPIVADPARWPLAFGTIIFAFEGINLIMPLRNKMADPDAFGGYNGVLFLGMTIVGVLYAIMGFFGFLSVGVDFQGVLTNYIIPLIQTDQLGWLYLICIILVVIQIYISYGLQTYVNIIIIYPPIAAALGLKDTKALVGEIIVRCLVAAVTFGLAAAIPCLGEIFDLVGAFTGSSLVILFPATIELVTFVPLFYNNAQHGKLVWLVIKNFLILVVGFAGFIIGTYTAIGEIATKLAAGACLQ